MTKPEFPQSQKRFQESIGSKFQASSDLSCLFLTSSTDIGVIRNGGRNGARFAPQSFLSTFKKLTLTEELRHASFHVIEVSSESAERSDFAEAQRAESVQIAKAISLHPQASLVHIGGGHDHIYPLLKALGEQKKQVIVLNIDAHADTRNDETFHSGTPFRQFAAEFDGDFHLIQLGLHPFANSFSTLSPLPRGKQTIVWRQELAEKGAQIFSDIKPMITKDTAVIFSLDADALSGTEVPGVSAVNGEGLSRQELSRLYEDYKKLPLPHAPIIGLYELNPVYDTVSSLSMRTMASFVFEALNRK